MYLRNHVSTVSPTILPVILQGEAYQPGSAGWTHAKWVFKSSALVGVTLRDRAVGIHMQNANRFVTAIAEQVRVSILCHQFMCTYNVCVVILSCRRPTRCAVC